jgi:hypothetical protein
MAFSVQKYIIRLDISMNNLSRMKMRQALKCLQKKAPIKNHSPSRKYTNLITYSRNLDLRNSIIINNIRQRPTFHELHNNPQLSLDQKRVQVIHNIRMLRLLHDQDLIHNEFFARLVGKVHLLDGDCGGRAGSWLV